MPEYLAPGVYVEETSFRAKSIEGVGTSTTAFVGPTRKGPVADVDTPLELLTSFGDFERIYGGLEDLRMGPNGDAQPNYIAHSVLNFFSEGGARLYVARVANNAENAARELRVANNAAGLLRVRSRFPGTNGNGRLIAREIAQQIAATRRNSFPEGSLLRVSDPAARAATLPGGALPVDLMPALGNAGAGRPVLNLTVNEVLNAALQFSGQPAAITAGADLADPVIVTPADQEFRLRVNGEFFTLQLAAAPAPGITRAQFVTNFNNALAAARCPATASLEANRLRLSSNRRGHQAQIEVLTERFGLPQRAVANEYHAVNNNVGDMGAFGLADLQRAVAVFNSNAANAEAQLEAVELPGRRFALRTQRIGDASRLIVRPAGAAPEASLHEILGVGAPGPVQAGAGATPLLFLRRRENANVPNVLIWRRSDDAATLDDAGVANRQLAILTFSAEFIEADGASWLMDDIAFGRDHPRGARTALAANPTSRAEQLTQPIAFEMGGEVGTMELYNALFTPARTRIEDGRRVAEHTLIGGTDGAEPMVNPPTEAGTYAVAFQLLRALENVSIVAAPGHSAFAAAEDIRGALITHASLPRAYRIAVLDSPPGQLPGEVQEYRGRFDSHRAALYYPWVTVANPLARPSRPEAPKEIQVPPSGFICGIYARNDVTQDVSKAPANEVVRGALRFEFDVNFAQNQLLNPLGVNCLRFFPGRGYRVWGARTASSDPEWKYVNVRRYFNYLEASIDNGTQWAVFENNGTRLWQNVRETIEDFLYNEWVSNRLLGDTPKQAYFVRCDRSTMTQNDLDNGRLICLVGVAALKPAEFVIFRIGQKTADARS
jgi:phage tail sheath protein FI